MTVKQQPLLINISSFQEPSLALEKTTRLLKGKNLIKLKNDFADIKKRNCLQTVMQYTIWFRSSGPNFLLSIKILVALLKALHGMASMLFLVQRNKFFDEKEIEKGEERKKET